MHERGDHYMPVCLVAILECLLWALLARTKCINNKCMRMFAVLADVYEAGQQKGAASTTAADEFDPGTAKQSTAG